MNEFKFICACALILSILVGIMLVWNIASRNRNKGLQKIFSRTLEVLVKSGVDVNAVLDIVNRQIKEEEIKRRKR